MGCPYLSAFRCPVTLWGKAAGRCEYRGCNKRLWIDDLTKAEFNSAYIAHIVADSPGGPRGDVTLSEKLADDISNLMLLCDEHHRLVDRADSGRYTVAALVAMKKEHEERVELLASLMPDRKSHVLRFGANVGEHSVMVSWDAAVQAMLPTWYPADKPGIELGFKDSSFQDREADYWRIEAKNLDRQFAQKVKPLLSNSDVSHLSVFALAPQPLLVELGKLICDIRQAEVYQLHREPPNWTWQIPRSDFDYITQEPGAFGEIPALCLALSATIDDARVCSALGQSASIWRLTVPTPHNDFLQGREQLIFFRRRTRELFDRIKEKHPTSTMIHVFPAVPVAVAVELGRIWMPKADLPMRIYDENRANGGFTPALDINA